jgi:hypothetical protein
MATNTNGAVPEKRRRPRSMRLIFCCCSSAWRRASESTFLSVCGEHHIDGSTQRCAGFTRKLEVGWGGGFIHDELNSTITRRGTLRTLEQHRLWGSSPSPPGLSSQHRVGCFPAQCAAEGRQAAVLGSVVLSSDKMANSKNGWEEVTLEISVSSVWELRFARSISIRRNSSFPFESATIVLDVSNTAIWIRTLPAEQGYPTHGHVRG